MNEKVSSAMETPEVKAAIEKLNAIAAEAHEKFPNIKLDEAVCKTVSQSRLDVIYDEAKRYLATIVTGSYTMYIKVSLRTGKFRRSFIEIYGSEPGDTGPVYYPTMPYPKLNDEVANHLMKIFPDWFEEDAQQDEVETVEHPQCSKVVKKKKRFETPYGRENVKKPQVSCNPLLARLMDKQDD